ncbi:hypothetical protein L6R46_11080 [Myxococcota bacterium]|jgi:hypothetical protein|nr:hypothetical protein [Myxococcota bacterium]
MRFELHSAAAMGDERSQSALTAILRRVEIGVHELSFDDPADVEETAWFIGLKPYEQELVRLLIEAQLWSWRPTHATPIRAASETHAAERLADAPLLIFVENHASDGALVRAAVLAYASRPTRKVWEAGDRETHRGWEFVPCGGTGEMPSLLRDYSQQRGVALRAVVVFDSDAKLPPRLANTTAGQPPDEHQKIMDAAQRLSVPCVRLPLREAENYLPDAFWDHWLRSDRDLLSYANTVEALKRLSPEQRDHIDMEGDDRLDIQKEEPPGPLFDGSDAKNPALDGADLAALSGKRKNLKRGPKIKGQDERVHRIRLRLLSKYVAEGNVTAEDLDSRDRAGSLRALVKLLSERL